MVIGEKFAWTHMGRTGGDATAQYFSIFSDYLKLEIDPPGLHKKHDTFEKRNVNNKILALNIRKLPSYFLSHIFHMPTLSKPPYPNTKDALDVKNPLSSLPDNYIKHYTNNLTLKINHWFRMEYLKEDILKFMQSFLEITPKIVNEIYSLKTKAVADYDHDVYNHWSDDEIATLYKNNPIWSEIEKARQIEEP